MKWKKNRVLVSIVFIVVLAYFSTISVKSFSIPGEQQKENFDLLAISDTSNLEILEAIFDAKNVDYATYGYYPQIYSGSLQATYYALYILDAIGKLGDIDQQAVVDYIMSFYNSSSRIFSDENSDRYLASKISGRYNPLSTLLQVNCYATLSLDILNNVNLIDIAGMVSFIWDCSRPIIHGFIGQPYDVSLEEGFKIPTADNTYYAVITLDTLGVDWNSRSQDRADICSYLESLQSLGSSTGFYNDKEGIFDSLMEPEPNQFASYYCVKTLEIFGSSYVDIIDTIKFHEHLAALYHSEGAYFDLSNFVWTVNYSNIVATAINLELADVTGFENYARSDVLDFLLNNRNYRGGWEASTTVKYHELIDTFQIVRSLSNTGDISHLSLSHQDELSSYIALFVQESGYSLLSEDYTSVDLLYSLISSYDSFGRIGELNIQELYDLLLGTVVDSNYDFFACTDMDLTRASFRSRPFDYYTAGFHDFVEKINSLRSHENLFKMLDSLKKIFKLNDFAAQYDLNTVLQDVIDSQFLDPSYPDNFGAFLVNNFIATPEWQNDLVYLKYSYYAIRAMETISQYLGLGDVTDSYFTNLGFDKTALGTFVARNVVETQTELYFDSVYSDNQELALENLYYTIYTLNAIDQLSLNASKINAFVVNHLNYSNAKNLYYSYKISEFLNLNVDFEIEQTQALIQSVYSDTYNEFYLSVERKDLEHDVLLWFCEIAKTDQLRLSASYSDTIRLGGVNLFSVELVNLILSDFGQYSTVKLESAQLGTILLAQLGNNTYQKEINVLNSPTNYPTVEGELCAYDGAIKKARVPFSFATEFDSEFTNTTIKTESRIQIAINGSHIFVSGREPIYGGSMYADVYRGGSYVDVIDLLTSHGSNNSTFTFDYSPIYFGNYSFEFYLNDPYLIGPQLIYSDIFNYEDPYPDPEPEPDFEFTYTVIKTESQIQVSVNGYYVLEHGTEPILGGSMYTRVFFDGDYIEVIDLLTYHGSNSSIFTFDYSPVVFGNYSFDFYLNDPNLADPQLLCNATLEYIDPNPVPDPVSEFTYTVTKTESQIQVDIIGYYAFVSGNQPILGGSMYSYIYQEGNFVDAIDLLTYHGSNSSIFTFDYSPIVFGNYSFDFYINDPYNATPQLICNATFEYIDPTPDPDPDPDFEFTYTVIKTESQIQVSINGYYVFISGNQPVFGGSVYANISLDGDYVEVIDLLTYHDSNSSIFLFDYSPVIFGNYSFDFYFLDSYLVNPQLICNATFGYIDPNPVPDPASEFTYTVIKTESQIQVNIIGYYVLVSENAPIIDGSMYSYIYRDGDYFDVIDLLTYHGSNSSIFTFDYSPVDFGNYSFDFYIDTNLVDLQLICNASLSTR